MKLLPSLTACAFSYQQPKYEEFLNSLELKASGWGAPTGKIAALWSLCSPLTAPANGDIFCDQSTCALVCDPGRFYLNSDFNDFKDSSLLVSDESNADGIP